MTVCDRALATVCLLGRVSVLAPPQRLLPSMPETTWPAITAGLPSCRGLLQGANDMVVVGDAVKWGADDVSMAVTLLYAAT